MDSKCLEGERFSKAMDENKFSYIFSANWNSNQIWDEMSDQLSDRSLGKKNSGPYHNSYQSFCQSSYWLVKNLSHITCFNYDQKDYNATWRLKLRESFEDPSSNDLSLESDTPNSAIQN